MLFGQPWSTTMTEGSNSSSVSTGGDSMGGDYGLSALASGLFGMRTTQDQQHANEAGAYEQQEWTKMMSDTAHQREVKDLTAAGLNPKLSGMGGSGASSSGGAAYTGAAPPQVAQPDFFGYGISMKQLEQRDRELQIMDNNSKAAIAKNLSSADLDKMNSQLAQRGMPAATLGGEATQILRSMIKNIKDSVQKNKQPTEFEYNSSGGELKFQKP